MFPIKVKYYVEDLISLREYAMRKRQPLQQMGFGHWMATCKIMTTGLHHTQQRYI